MHFWVSVARAGVQGGVHTPRKYGTNWFMPAFVNNKPGLWGIKEAEGTTVCCFSRKKSRKLWRISVAVIISIIGKVKVAGLCLFRPR